jgi:hypothetical protein
MSNSTLSYIIRRVLSEADDASMAAQPPAPSRLTPLERSRKATRRFFHDVFHLADKHGAKYPGIVAAQAAHESGWGTSPAARQKNNILGLDKKDPSAPEGQTRRTFKSLDDCIKFYIRNIEPKLSATDQGRWTREIIEEIASNNYAQDKSYLSKIFQLVAGPTIEFDMDAAYANSEINYFLKYEDELKELGYRTGLVIRKDGFEKEIERERKEREKATPGE